MIAAIGFMEYSIIDDAAAAGHAASRDVVKKVPVQEDIVIARNMQMDDDEEDAAVRYVPHAIYHCDVLVMSCLFTVPKNPVRAAVLSPDLSFADPPLYDCISSYRI